MKMNNNRTSILPLVIIITTLLLIAIVLDENEMKEYKNDLAQMKETITQLETDNVNLREELDAQKRRADDLQAQIEEQEEQAQTSAYVYHYNSYHDSDYDDMSAKDYIAQRESGGNYQAQNGQYYGKYQLQIDMLGGDLSPENQEETAERYVIERYGSWENAQEFWDNHGWY